jgi:hypothetical protein
VGAGAALGGGCRWLSCFSEDPLPVGRVRVDGRGQQLGPTKTEGARGEHYLMPTVIEWLRRHRERQAEEQAAAPYWETITYEGEAINLVFTTPTGGLVLRQTVAKVVKQAAKTAGIAVEIGTHAGRSSVITTLCGR